MAAPGRRAGGRWEKAMSYKSHMYGGGESYSGVVPTKQPNEGRGRPQEAVEGRPLTKENTEQTDPSQTPSWEAGQTGWNVCEKQPYAFTPLIRGRNRVR